MLQEFKLFILKQIWMELTDLGLFKTQFRRFLKVL